MHKVFNYLFPPLFYFFVARLGSFFTSKGVKTWYETIEKPSFTPPGYFIGIIWTIIFILSAISMIYFLKNKSKDILYYLVLGIYLINGFFNVLWSYLFFVRHSILFAFFDAMLIGLTVFLIIILLWKEVKHSSLLLIPYLLWVIFATYLNYKIFVLNQDPVLFIY